VSYQLHRSLGSEALVAREYPVRPGARADVAVIRGTSLVGAIEAKAMATADCTRTEGKRREYPDALQADLDRYADLACEPLEVYCLLLGMHPLQPPPRHLGHAIKYSALLSGAFRRHAGEEAIRRAAQENLDRFLRDDVQLARGSVEGGTAFGIRVDVLWWLYGPFTCPGELRILNGSASA
jgi:hypothetical protein